MKEDVVEKKIVETVEHFSGNDVQEESIRDKDSQRAAVDDSGVDLMNLKNDAANTKPSNESASSVFEFDERNTERSEMKESQSFSNSRASDRNKLKLSLETSSSCKRSATSPSLSRDESDPNLSSSPHVTTPSYAKMRHIAQSPVAQLTHLPVTNNPYMSPFLADEEMLSLLPPVYLVVSSLSPLLRFSLLDII